MRIFLQLLAALVCLAQPLASATEPKQTTGPTDVTKSPVDRLGPHVGERLPDFVLPDQNGRRRTLASLMGEKGLVLVFSRSADW
jgi:cytochrome oxidase Cu insertion factor (SCO1/SenC/PrrC family)